MADTTVAITPGTGAEIAVEDLGAAGKVQIFKPRTISQAHLITAATTNATNIKASAGKLRSVHVFNNAATPIYVKFHNTAGTPTAGSGVVLTVGVQASLLREFIPPGPIAFATGIGMTVVLGMADNDSTAVALNDASIEVCYE